MSVHISEIGVRLAVGAAPAIAPPAPAGQTEPRTAGHGVPEDLVDRCVQRVLDHLRALEAR